MKKYKIVFLVVLIGWMSVRGWGSLGAAESLESEFSSPPMKSRPHTWWHWMNGNVSKEGITADLEAMKRVGISGATLFNVNLDCPPGPVPYRSESWWEMNLFAAQEAKRLGMTLGMANCAGWSSSGGPWVTPDQAMQTVATTEIQIKGGSPVEVRLPSPPVQKKFPFHDIAVLAFPTPSEEKIKLSDIRPKITASALNFNGQHMIDQERKTAGELPIPVPEKPSFIQFEFSEPYRVRSLSLLFSGNTDNCSGEIQASDDGHQFRKLADFAASRQIQPNWPECMALQHYAFKETMVRFYRVVFTKSQGRSPLIKIAEVDLSPRVVMNDLSGKADFELLKRPLIPMWTSVPSDQIIDPKKIIDLTSKTDSEGQLKWDAPPGDWTVLRISYTPIDRSNHPAPPGGAGLEIDKFSRAAAKSHWEAGMGKMREKLGSLTGSTWNEVLIDSYEVRAQNWTAKFPEEFTKRRSYDLRLWLPALTGRMVESVDHTERFMSDFRRTIAELYAENYYDYFAEMARESGLQLAVEPYGNAPFEELRVGRDTDIVMGEFWPPTMILKNSLSIAASTAHLYGKKIVGAEAFTSELKWTESPRSMKPFANEAFAAGINYFELHRYVHQPWLHRAPGLSLGEYGSHLERTNTWWEQSGAWIDYMARCQHLLRQGLYVADVLYFRGENAVPMDPVEKEVRVPLPEGYSSDTCGADVILNRLKTKEGRIVLPDGMSYRVLVLSNTEAMTPALLRKLKELVDGGATIVGSKPVRAPGLTDYPKADVEVRRLADELWNGGKIRPVKTLQEVLGPLKVTPDFIGLDKSVKLFWIHRAEAGRDIYFVANGMNTFQNIPCQFRVSGKRPELWDPLTGKTEAISVYEDAGGQTRLGLRLDPFGSVFVVFKERTSSADHPVTLTRSEEIKSKTDSFPDGKLVDSGGKLALEAWTSGHYTVKMAVGKSVNLNAVVSPAIEIKGSWDVSFPPQRGAPEKAVFDSLMSWSAHQDPGIKYFSGTSTYRKEFEVAANQIGVGQRFYLDLGAVEVLAGVKLNGKELGVLWSRPYVVELTSALKPGRNELELAVTNLWPNRLIGDEQLSQDSAWGRALKEWPQWLQDNLPRPSGRIGFTYWKFYKKEDPLLPSGLIGPVTVRSSVTLPVPVTEDVNRRP